jgi:hypothetical protein
MDVQFIQVLLAEAGPDLSSFRSTSALARSTPCQCRIEMSGSREQRWKGLLTKLNVFCMDEKRT